LTASSKNAASIASVEPAARSSRAPKVQPLSPARYVEGVLSGDRSILARAITLIESSRPADRAMASQIVEACLPSSGNSIRVGITGVPGAGKSSLIETLGKHLIQDRGEKVAVLAIDPSSEISGGSILGDKTRMTFLAASPSAFIRPSPARGSAGGVAHHTRDAMILCEAAGYKNIFIETVGVGQSETAVREMVDFLLLTALAGAGDELQGIKRGVMEMADVIAVNKTDGNNIAAAERARVEAENALHFFPAARSGWTPRAISCSAQTGRGIASIWAAILEHQSITKANGWLDRVRREQQLRWMNAAIEQGLHRLFHSHPAILRNLKTLEQDVLEGRVSPLRAASSLLETYALQDPIPIKKTRKPSR